MQMMLSIWRRFRIVAVLAFPLSVPITASDSPILVEIWHRGDDVVSLRFHEAVENAFKSSPNFALTSAGHGDVVVTIPDHVEVRRKFWRKRVYYTVEFATKNGQKCGLSQGSCWERSITRCANDVLKDAKIAATKAQREKRDH